MIWLRPASGVILAALTLPGCAASGYDYPSLAIRSNERVHATYDANAQPAPEAAPAPARAPIPGETIQHLAQLLEQTNEAHRIFMDAAPGAAQLVEIASDAALASDDWARAQVALADLESSRSQAAVPLGDIDLMFADATLVFDRRDAIANTRDAIISLISEQDAVLDTLRGRLAQ